ADPSGSIPIQMAARWFYGWNVVAAVFVMAMLSFGLGFYGVTLGGVVIVPALLWLIGRSLRACPGMESDFGQQPGLGSATSDKRALRTESARHGTLWAPNCQPVRGRVRMQQHRNIEVGGATLECTLYGSGTPVVLLANAGCSVGYFEDLARVLAAGGLQTISINMRGTGESRGSLDGITVHDLAADVAGVLEAIDCGPAHLVGHAFGNRIAPCLAVDQPPLVRSVTLLAAGGLIGPPTPVGTPFRNAKQSKMNGSDCVTVLGARWLSPASDPKILERVECWPAIFIAHLATSRNVPLEQWWSGGDAPLLALPGLDDEVAPPGNGHALGERVGERVRVVDLPRAGHFLLLEQPEAVVQAVSEFLGAGAVPR